MITSAWDRYKDLLHACPHYGFTELHQLDTFYNALNPTDQDSLNVAAGGNLLERSTQDVLTIIENKSKVCNSRSKPLASQVKACDTNSNSEIAKLTHAVNQQTSVVTTAMTVMLKQFQATPPPAPVKDVEEFCITCGGAHLYYQCLATGGNTFPEFKDNIQGYVSAAAVNYNQAQQNHNFHLNELEKIKKINEANMKAIQTQINMVKNELRTEMKSSIQTSLSNQTNEIKNMMASLLQMNTASTSGSGSLPSNTVANPKGKLKAITTRNGLVTDGPTCKVLADLGASINLMPLSVWKELGLPELIPTRMTLELANRVICTPAGIARDVYVPIGKFTFPANFAIVYYESDPRVPLILGRPFLRTARALIDVHGEEMILRDGDERLTLNIKHDTSSYSNQPQRELVNFIFNVSSGDFLEVLFSNQPSGNPTFSPHQELTSSKVTNDIFDSEGCNFDIESDLKEIEFLLYQDKDSSLKDSNDQKGLANLDAIFIDPIPEMFTGEHTLDYSSLSKFDVYDDDFLEVESDAENVYDDPFDSNREKIKESKLLIDELDLPCDFHPPFEYDSFISQDFSRVNALSSTNNEDKVFNP
nr:reverse transcriptase domain-containing protein [Tanacetum cinerariifolium]